MSDSPTRTEVWAQGDAYEPYVGRWSRLVAREFVKWLGVHSAKRWLDVGSGTGALSQTILETASPESVVGIDRSEAFAEYARRHVQDPRITFRVGDGQDLVNERGGYDVVVSGLVLNFVPSPEKMISEMARACRLNGKVGLYIWDYAGEMQMMRHFWNAAAQLDPAARTLDEGLRFETLNSRRLWDMFLDAGLNDVTRRSIDVPTHFRDFDDYWTPFEGGQGPAPAYTMSLSAEKRTALREQIRAQLPHNADGSIDLIARAWAVKSTR